MLTTSPHLEVRRPSPTTAEFTVTTCPPPTISNRLLLGIVFLLRLLLALAVLLLVHATWTLPPAPEYTAAHAIPGAAPRPGYNSSAVPQPYSYHGDDHLSDNNNNNNNTHQATPTAAAAAAAAAPPLPPPPAALLTPAWLPYALAHLARTPPGRALASLPASAALPPWALYALCAALLYLVALRVHTTESLLVLRGLGVQTSSTGGSYLASRRAGTRFIPTEKIRDVLINEAFRGFGVRYYLVVVVDGEDDVVVVFPRLLPGRRIVERVWRGVRGCLWEPPEGGGMLVGRKVEDRGGIHG